MKKVTLADRVMDICAIFPEYVGNGNKIILEYWNNFDPNLTTPASSILRTYRRLCASGDIQLNTQQKEQRERYHKHSVAKVYR